MTMTIADEIKARVTTRQLCEHVGLALDRNGNALCPFHGDSNKSLKVYKDPKRGWACFGCHRGGTVLDFAMAWYDIDFQQALVRLDTEFGLGLPMRRKLTKEERLSAHRRLVDQERRKRDAENARKAAEYEFWAMHDRYCELLNVLDEERPKRGENELSVRYASALHLLPSVRDDFEKAHFRLENARREESLIGTECTAGPTA